MLHSHTTIRAATVADADALAGLADASHTRHLHGRVIVMERCDTNSEHDGTLRMLGAVADCSICCALAERPPTATLGSDPVERG
jgi:hypothetical protein